MLSLQAAGALGCKVCHIHGKSKNWVEKQWVYVILGPEIGLWALYLICLGQVEVRVVSNRLSQDL